jgi:carbamoyl-phosphate synthase large subunit
MKSTGEVMGLDSSFGTAFAKSQTGSYGGLPLGGRAFVSIANRDKRHAIFPVKRLADLGFEIVATRGTAQVLRRNGIDVSVLRKAHESGDGASVVDEILGGRVDLVFNTPQGASTAQEGGADGGPRHDGWAIRSAAILRDIPCITTVQGLSAAVQGIEAAQAGKVGVRSLQDWHATLSAELGDAS